MGILQAKYLAEQFKYLSSLLGSLDSPLRESEYVVESLEHESSQHEEKSGETCSTTEWLSNTSQYLDKFKGLEQLFEKLEKAGTTVLARQGKWIADKYSELAYWHERKSRENNDYEDYVEE